MGKRRLPRAVGPAAARQVRRARRRHRDGLAAEQVPAAPRRRRRRGEARLPEALLGAALQRAARPDRGRRRARADRPPRREARPGFIVTPGAPNSFRRGHDPRDFETLEPERYDAVLATVPSDVFEQLLEPGVLPEAYLAQLRGIEYFTALCLLIELDRQFSPYYWTNIGDDALPFVGPDRAHEPDRARALRRPPLPLRRQLPAARPRAARSRRRRPARALHARSAGGQPGVRPRLGQAALAAPRAGRAADRHRRLPGQDPGHEDPDAAVSCWPTRPRSSRRTAARTTRCARATRPRAADAASDARPDRLP